MLANAALKKVGCGCCTPTCAVSASALCQRLSGTLCTPCRPVITFATPDIFGRTSFTVTGGNPPGGAFRYPCDLTFLEFWVTPPVITCGGTDFWFDSMYVTYGCPGNQVVVEDIKARAFLIPLSQIAACCDGNCQITISILYKELAPSNATCECFDATTAKLVALVSGSLGAAGTGLFYCEPPGPLGACACFSIGATAASGVHAQPLWGWLSSQILVQQNPPTWSCGGQGQTTVSLGLCNPNLLGSNIFASWSAAAGFSYRLVSGQLTLVTIGVSGSIEGGGGPDSLDQVGCASGATAGGSSYISGSPHGAVNINLGPVSTNLQLCKAVTNYFSGKSYTFACICSGGPTCTVSLV